MEEIDALVSVSEENIDGRILARSKSQRKFNRRVQRPHRERRPQSEHQRRECCRDWCRFVYNITLVFAHQPPENTALYHLGVQVTEQPKSKFIHSCRDKSPAIVKQPVQPSVGKFRGRQAPLNLYRLKFSHDRREQKKFGLLTKQSQQ